MTAVKVMLTGSQGKLVGDISPTVLVEISKMCSFRPEGIEFSDKVKNKEWDGVIHLFRNRHFPIGLLQRVVEYLVLCGIDFEVLDNRAIRSKKIELHSTYKMRDYQQVVVDDAIQAQRALIPVAVGGGKTIISTEIIAKLGLKTLFICPTIEILEQTKKVLHEGLNMDIGLIHEKTFNPKHVTISTWQTINSKLKKRENAQPFLDYLASVDVLVWDEVHRLGADKLFEVSMHVNATYRYGLSGSLFRSDGQELKYYAGIGEAIKGLSASELIDMGFLVPPKIRFINTPPMPFGWKDKWHDVYSQGVVNNFERNKIIAEESKKLVEMGRTVLVMVSEVEHGKNLKALMDDAVFVDASSKDRRQIIDMYRQGHISCLIATGIIQEGFDMPEITAIVVAAGGKSPILAVQRVGRGLRICPEIGKKDVIVIEFNDVAKYLFDHSYERYCLYKMERRFNIEGDIPGRL